MGRREDQLNKTMTDYKNKGGQYKRRTQEFGNSYPV
jgi:hypothetical protein